MKKYLKFIEWIPFSICLGSLIIYILYTIHIKLHPQVIVTDKLVSTLKFYLIIALVSLFIGLLIILIKKIYYLRENSIVIEDGNVNLKKETKYKTVEVVNNDTNKVISENINDKKIIVNTSDDSVTLKPSNEEIVKETIVQPKNYTYKLNEVVCPECGGSISKNAAICPHCGILFDKEVLRILRKHEKRKKKRPLNPFWIVINLILIIILIILIILVSKALYNKFKLNKANLNPFEIVERR